MIETKNLTRKFRNITAVDNISFNIEKGEVFGFLGPNGAGKTTTIRMLACLISPTEGTATVAGYDIRSDPTKVRESIGILTENPSLYERLTAYENMDFFAAAYGIKTSDERQQRIRELLDFFNLWDRRNDKVATFSKGMKQKLAIVRAIVHRPPVLFLDEPTAGLDPESAKEIRDLMFQLSQHEKRTILLCTHHLEDAEKLCKRVLIMNKGRCILTGSPNELRDKINPQPVLEIELTKVSSIVLNAIKNENYAKEVKVLDQENIIAVSVGDARVDTPKIVRTIVEAQGQILSAKLLRPSLEEAYLKLIKEGKQQ